MPTCPRCEHENREGARFCDACGAALAESIPREERKVVTVLFADVVGFTRHAEGLDPEDVRALQDPYWQHVRAELERYGGTVEKFIGDAVVGLFGAPVAHEDDPERAVRAALAIRDWAREQDEIRLRVGITTGETLVRLGARPLAGEGMASGDVVNTASRLQGAAPADGILVDEATHRATSGAIDYADAEAVSAKGKAEPIRVWEALGAHSRIGVDLFEHARTPLVGRERELDVLQDALVRVREERSPQLVTLLGVPGIGKSRLVYELMRSVEEDREIVTWRQGRSLPYGDGVSFWALAEIVKAEAGILETDSDTAAATKLVRGVKTLVHDDTEARWVERHLRGLVGLGGESVVPAGRSEAFAAWRRFVELLAERRATVLVFEDLQWADEGLLDFVDSLVGTVADVPLLVIGAARPELLELRPTWGGGKANALTLSLSPLSSAQTLRLVRELAEEQQLSTRAEAALVEQVGGNALYAEQYVRVLEERGEAEELPRPETLQSLIAARLDDLPATEKAVLQNAAVVGKVFWHGAVVAVDGIEAGTAGECLRSLQRKQFVQRAQRSAVAEESEFAFRHVLVRDVAYNQIPRARRAEKHERAAAWLNELARPDDYAEMLAHHYLSAFELAGAVGGDTTTIAAHAQAALRRAGDRAFALHAYPAAARYYARAIDLFGAEDDELPELVFRHAQALANAGADDADETLERARDALIASGSPGLGAEACVLLAEIWWHRGQRERTNEQLERAQELIASTSDSPSKAWVLTNISRSSMLAGDPDSAVGFGRQALAIAETLGLDDVRAHALNNIGTARCSSGDLRGIADLEQSIQIAAAGDAPGELSRAYNNLATVYGEHLGQLRRAHELRQKAFDVALSVGNQRLARYAAGVLVYDDYFAGNWDEFIARIHDYFDESKRLGGGYQDAFFHAALGNIAFARGDDAQAAEEVRQALALAEAAGDPQIMLAVLADSAVVHLHLGDTRAAQALARRLADEGLERLRAGSAFGNFPLSAELGLAVRQLGIEAEVRTILADVPGENRWAPPFTALLDGDYAEAADAYAEIGPPPVEAYVRYHGGKRLLESGRIAEAKAQLERALAFYRRAGATRYVDDAEAMLAEIAAGDVQEFDRSLGP